MDGQTQSQSTLTRVTDFVLRLAAPTLPASVMDRAALLLLDTLGICIAAAPMDAGRYARETALRLNGATDANFSARMLFDGRRVSLAGAAFAAASQIDNLDGHDGFNPVKGHIGVAVVPALAALAETLDLTGPDALAGLVVGYEIAGRAGLSLHATVSDYHTSGAWNALGVAAMGARLRGASDDILRQALGIAEYHGPRSQMMREIATPTMLHDGSGMGAMVGLSAIVMAELGFNGAPAVTVEAAEVAPFWADLGLNWQVLQQYIKPYPTCRWAHAPIDAARELAMQHDLQPDQIAAVRIFSFANACALFGGLPDTTSKAQYALAFPVAVMLAHGHIGLDHISGAGLSDPVVGRLVGRTTAIAVDRHEVRFPNHRTADIEIDLTDGRTLRSGDTHARGGVERPFGMAEIVAKFQDYAAPVIGRARADAIQAAVMNLTQDGSRFADLAAHLYDGPTLQKDPQS